MRGLSAKLLAINFINNLRRFKVAHRWYIIHVHSGFEKQVAATIKEDSARKNLEAQILEVVIPHETVVEVRQNKRHHVDRKFFPGYILVQMDLTNESWNLVKNTNKVTGFLGQGNKPSPMPESEAQRIIAMSKGASERPRSLITYVVGEQVRVSDGPFASFNGIVEDVDEEKSRLKVVVAIFGRSTPVELEFTQVEKI